jgi:cyclopropane fatty-acyl-phospholipid synthase-like methyltransferase
MASTFTLFLAPRVVPADTPDRRPTRSEAGSKHPTVACLSAGWGLARLRAVASAGDDTASYDVAYGRVGDAVYTSIRREAFGEDIGQNSWLTADELRAFAKRLGVDSSSELLEVGSGSGGPALFTAATTGSRITGVDSHEGGVAAANEAACERGLADRARVVVADARKRQPFDDGSFDAILCIDAIDHIYERAEVLRDWHRLLRGGGRVPFTNPITVTGLLRREEMIVRSGGMGAFVFTPPGVDERLVREAGFVEIRVEDASENPAWVAAAWHTARKRRATELDRIEGATQNASTQRFLSTVATLASEQRLSRYAYIARRR